MHIYIKKYFVNNNVIKSYILYDKLLILVNISKNNKLYNIYFVCHFIYKSLSNVLKISLQLTIILHCQVYLTIRLNKLLTILKVNQTNKIYTLLLKNFKFLIDLFQSKAQLF